MINFLNVANFMSYVLHDYFSTICAYYSMQIYDIVFILKVYIYEKMTQKMNTVLLFKSTNRGFI